MALTVEDGTGKSDADSYVDEADFTAYLAKYEKTVTGTKETLLLQAMQYLESKRYRGVKKTQAQALQFPRYDVVVDGYLLASDEIPVNLKNAQMENALAIDGGENPMDNQDRVVKREKIGVLETEYATDGRSTTYLKTVESLLSKLTINITVVSR